MKKRNKTYAWTKCLFVYYLLLLVWLVLFKLDFTVPHSPRGINWIPFFRQSVTDWREPVREAAANIIAFLPMGLYLNMLAVTRWKIVVGGFVTSFALELAQFVFSMGLADVTNLITAAVGTVCGVLLYILLCKLFDNSERVNRGLAVAGTIGTVLAMVYFILLLMINLLLLGLLAAFFGGGAR